MIIDCKDESSIVAVLDKQLVKFLNFNSKTLNYESKNYFVTNLYAFMGEGDAVRLRRIYPITNEVQVQQLASQFAKMLEDLNRKYNIIAFEGSVKDEDSSIKLFK